jgi:hypothetical protein
VDLYGRARRVLRQVHLWTSLVLCLPLVVLGVTGSILVFRDELGSLFEPPPRLIVETGKPHAVTEIIAAVQARKICNVEADEVALIVEGVVNRTVQAEEALGGSSRLEPLQFALASSDCLMRILRPIVVPKPLLMPAGQSQTPERRDVGAQLEQLRVSGCAARVSRRRWTCISRTSPS